MGVLASEGWWEAWPASPKVDPGAFSVQRQGWKTPRGPPGNAVLLRMCSSSALLGDQEVNRYVGHDHLSVLTIYPRIFLRVFIVYCLLLGILFILLYFIYVTCFGLVVGTQYLPRWLSRKTPLMTPLCCEITSTKTKLKRLCVFFFYLVCLCC